MKTLCLDCGGLIDKPGGSSKGGARCQGCLRLKQQAKRVKRPRASAAETRRRARTVAIHRAKYGNWCPGWRRPPHPATDLTADHIVPVAAGGAEHGDHAVLCRSCNGAKGKRL